MRFYSRTLRKKLTEQLFKSIGVLFISLVCVILFIILLSIVNKGYKAFYTHRLLVTIHIAKELPANTAGGYEEQQATWDNMLNSGLAAMAKQLRVTPISNDEILSTESYNELQQYFKNHPDAGYSNQIPLLLNSNSDMYLKGYKAAGAALDPNVAAFINAAKAKGLILKKFTTSFLTNSDSRYAESAGILGALKGSIITILLTLIFSFTIGLTSAVYLEEFAKKSTFKSLIEVNINNLAAVPSIIFGLLGLVLFQFLLQIPRSSPLLAALVLTLMVLPTIIISSQIALRGVPKTIKEAAYGIGASKNQVIFSHIVPFALPGILTGVVIAIARAIGETAPLLIIGMFAFIPTISFNVTQPATTIPVQILLWFSLPETGFIEKASAAIMILLIIIVIINIVASLFRKRLENRR